MRSSKNHAPYSLYKKSTKSGLFWYVRFWDAETKKYNTVRSTGIPVEGKRERWREADDAAKAILDDLKQASSYPEHSNTSYSKSSEKLFIPSSPLLHHEDLGYEVKNIMPERVKDISFVQYLEDFWRQDSAYAKYKRDVKKKPLSSYYIQMNHDDVARHIEPFPGMKNARLGDITLKLLK